MSVSVADLAVDDYVHDDSRLYRVVDAERLVNWRYMIRLENASPAFFADFHEPFYDVRVFSREDVETMELVKR